MQGGAFCSVPMDQSAWGDRSCLRRKPRKKKPGKAPAFTDRGFSQLLFPLFAAKARPATPGGLIHWNRTRGSTLHQGNLLLYFQKQIGWQRRRR